jgi:processive 1,2-diacylglycerol beta-glucosyltransferase
MPKRILILSASVGAGHLRAAQAVELAANQLLSRAAIENVDILTLTNPAFRRVYGTAYLDLVNKAPHVLGYFYDRLDRRPSPRRKSDRLRLAVEKLNLRSFIKFLEAEPWDVIINTHFLPAEIIASLKRKKRLATPQITATTDFETHRLWVNQPCEHYFTATAEGAANLEHWGVPRGDISVTGIPIHPVFSEKKTREECLKRQGLAGKTPVVLLLAGGFGVGPIERIFEAVVCGRNEALRKRIEAAESPKRHRTKVLGFTDQMDELMAAADIVVSKPGGLTTSEALARGVAIAIVNPIPGQESRNSDFLLENGAAIKINNISTLAYKLGELLGDRSRLATLKVNAKRLGRPRAAFDVVERALVIAEQAAS